ncbi:MAG: hypothetical protein LBU46_01035, partial [Candidatus Accumulibacter sp.]|nr:hypothetical protein [Accumulibacter sp.]
ACVIIAYGIAIGQIGNKIHGLKARVIPGMTHALSPHRSCATETHGLAMGYETRLWRVVFWPNNPPALYPCEMPWRGYGFYKKTVNI